MAADLPPAPLPSLSLHDGVIRDQVDASQIVGDWLSKLEDCFKAKSLHNLSGLFIEDCWWRDIVGLSWDFATKHGQESISKYLSSAPSPLANLQYPKSGPLQPKLMDMGGLVWIQAGFTFKNPHGEGKGIVRLANTGRSEWKAWTVFTQLLQLDLQKDLTAEMTQNTPALQLNSAASGLAEPVAELQVLIVGAGQSGLALAARLRSLNIKTLVVEKTSRVGDVWRARYDNLKLHTPRYTDYYPFLKTPDNWPKYIGRDRIANFMEHYSQLMELDVLLETTVTNVEYNEEERRYYVKVQSPGGTRTFISRHVVLNTGLFSNKPIFPDIPGQESFQGQLYHSVEHKSASHIPDLHNKKVVIIGAGPSAHDLALDFASHKAKEVAMIQRSPTYSISPASNEAVMLAPWDTEGISTEDADLMANSLPLPILRTMSAGLSQMICAQDKAMIDDLSKAGLRVRRGEDGIGLADFQLIRGGQFYIDQGANQMIIDGRIKIINGESGVKGFRATGLTLADGTFVDADVIVFATGFHVGLVTVRGIMGEEFMNKAGNFGNLDGEQERCGWWRPTGIPGFWYMTGSFIWGRQFSLSLALQIAAVENGLNKAHYEQK